MNANPGGEGEVGVRVGLIIGKPCGQKKKTRGVHLEADLKKFS